VATAIPTPTTTDDDLTAGAAAAVERAQLLYPDDEQLARDVLTPYADEAKVRDLLQNMDRIADPPADSGEGEGGGEAQLVEKLEGIRETLAAADELELPGATRDDLVKAERSLQREILGKHNPAAASAWDETWGQVHGVA
jgi:hypothetical protein